MQLPGRVEDSLDTLGKGKGGIWESYYSKGHADTLRFSALPDERLEAGHSLSIDGGLGAESGPGPSPGIRARALEASVRGHFFGCAPNGQIAHGSVPNER
jgi:hypothetical protein